MEVKADRQADHVTYCPTWHTLENEPGSQSGPGMAQARWGARMDPSRMGGEGHTGTGQMPAEPPLPSLVSTEQHLLRAGPRPRTLWVLHEQAVKERMLDTTDAERDRDGGVRLAARLWAMSCTMACFLGITEG